MTNQPQNQKVNIPMKDALMILDDAVSKSPLTRMDHANCINILQGIKDRLEQADEMERKLAELEKSDGDQN